MNWYQKAVIIGYWRSGMKWEEISLASGESTFECERICLLYQRGLLKFNFPAYFKNKIK